MQPPHSFLVAVDFSDTSAKAVEAARALVTGLGGKITLVTVFDPTPMVPATELATLADSWWNLMDEQEARLEQLLVEMEAERLEGVASSVRVIRCPSVAQGVELAAEDAGAEMIVVGSHGRTGLKRVLLGSIAESILRQSSRPVLVAR